MNNKELFKAAFSEIHVSEEKITEVITMKNKNKIKHFYGKKLLILAASFVLLLSSIIVVNAVTGGEILKNMLAGFGTNIGYDKDSGYYELTHKYTAEEAKQDEMLSKYVGAEPGEYKENDGQTEYTIVVKEDGNILLKYKGNEVSVYMTDENGTKEYYNVDENGDFIENGTAPDIKFYTENGEEYSGNRIDVIMLAEE